MEGIRVNATANRVPADTVVMCRREHSRKCDGVRAIVLRWCISNYSLNNSFTALQLFCSVETTLEKGM